MPALLTAFAVVFVAEFGDRSQLLALTFATRYRAANTLLGFALGIGVMMTGAVAVGALVGDRIRPQAMSVISGLLFLAFAVWILVDRSGSDDEDIDEETLNVSGTGRARTVLGVAVAVLFAEFGDKTMLATITMAAKEPPLAVWLGAFAGMFSADALAVLLGDRIGRVLSPNVIKFGTAAVFALVGLTLLYDGLR